MKTKILRLLLTIAIMAAFISAIVMVTRLLSPEIINYAVMGLLLFLLGWFVYQILKDTIYPDNPVAKSEPRSTSLEGTLCLAIEKPVEPKKRGRKPKTEQPAPKKRGRKPKA